MQKGAIYFTLVGIVLLLLFNAFPFLWPKSSGPYLKPDWIRGMAVVDGGKDFTLNFDQQNRMVQLLNRSLPLQRDPNKTFTNHQGWSKIVVYGFGGVKDLEIYPIAWDEAGSLVFRCDEWSSKEMIDLSAGELKSLIVEILDPPLSDIKKAS